MQITSRKPPCLVTCVKHALHKTKIKVLSQNYSNIVRRFYQERARNSINIFVFEGFINVKTVKPTNFPYL